MAVMKNTPSFSDLEMLFRGPFFEPSTIPAYPPYNIYHSTDGTSVKLAVAAAGFSQSDLGIEVVNNKLIITGTKPEQTSDGWEPAHKGIAERNFTLKLHKNPDFEVDSASFEDGMLIVILKKVAGFAQKIAINSPNQPQLLTE